MLAMLYPAERFLVLVSVKAVSPRFIMQVDIYKLKKISDLIGNNTRDLLACRIA
jgi:hypothetical protein